MARHLVRWNPRYDFPSLRHEMNLLFDEALDRRMGHDERYIQLPIDAYTTKDALVIVAAIPGVSPEDVEITWEGEMLTIKGELPAPLGNVDYVSQERVHGPFLRAINVSVPVQADKIEAAFDRGLLIVTLPKVEEVKPKTIAVKVSG
jgi:HSP20 family protein